jgi:hypothetical protein
MHKCVKVSILPLSAILRLVFGTVPTVLYFLFPFYFFGWCLWSPNDLMHLVFNRLSVFVSVSNNIHTAYLFLSIPVLNINSTADHSQLRFSFIIKQHVVSYDIQ